MIIPLRTEDRAKAEMFADHRTKRDATFYKSSRGAFKRKDIIVGALGEMAAYKYLQKMGEIDVNEPDFSLYDLTNKSFQADLFNSGNGVHYHVKSQSKESEALYGNSYLCQKSDKLVKSPEGNHFLICTLVDLVTNEVEIVAEFCSVDINWGEPKLDWLKRNKVALYIGDQKNA